MSNVNPIAVRNDLEVKVSFEKALRPNKEPLRSKIRAKYLGLKIRYLAKQGYTVFLVGAALSGKTYLLNNNFSGQIVSGQMPGIIPEKQSLTFSVENLKPGIIAVDEPQNFTIKSIHDAADKLRKAGVVFTVQQLTTINRLGLNQLSDKIWLMIIGESAQLLFDPPGS